MLILLLMIFINIINLDISNAVGKDICNAAVRDSAPALSWADTYAVKNIIIITIL